MRAAESGVLHYYYLFIYCFYPFEYDIDTVNDVLKQNNNKTKAKSKKQNQIPKYRKQKAESIARQDIRTKERSLYS